MMALADSLIAGPRLSYAFQYKTNIYQKIEPLAERARIVRHFEFRQTFPGLWRRGAENPFGDLAVEVVEIIAHFEGICQALVIAKEPSMRRIKAWMHN